jgi:hypothetical protein
MTPDPSPRKPPRPWLQRNAYWLMLVAALLALIVYQEHRRRRTIHAPIAIGLPPAYCATKVTLDGKPHPLPDLIASLATQSHLQISTLCLPDSSLLDKPIALNAGICSLYDALEQVRIALLPQATLRIDFGTESIALGDQDLVYSSRRTSTVIYPVSDLVLADDPLLWAGDSLNRMQQMEDLIRSNAQPDVWREAGGTCGTCTHTDTNLIITASPGMHRQIEQLLQALRAVK